MSAVLCLNRAYMPVNVYVDYEDAVKKVENGRAEIVSTYPDKILRSWKDAMEAPAIIRLLYFLNPPKRHARYVPYSRKNIWLRDKGHCMYCGKFLPIGKMHVDHVLPRLQGGKTHWLNIVCACFPCNSKKGGRTPDQASMRLRGKPFVPKSEMSQSMEIMMRIRSLKNLPHESWKQFLYYNIELDHD